MKRSILSAREDAAISAILHAFNGVDDVHDHLGALDPADKVFRCYGAIALDAGPIITRLEEAGVLARDHVAAYWTCSHVRIAVIKAYTVCVKQHLRKRVDLDLALTMAAAQLDARAVREVLDDGANVHFDDDKALRVAARRNALEVVRLLLERGANLGQVEFVRLCEARAKLDAVRTPFLVERQMTATLEDSQTSPTAKPRTVRAARDL